MGQRHTLGVTRENAIEQQRRDQEVLRAKRELAAYFKGRRTEREARAALKIIKAFIRDRERRDERSRPPLPGTALASTSRGVEKQHVATGQRGATKPRRTQKDPTLEGSAVSIESPMHSESVLLSNSNKRASK